VEIIQKREKTHEAVIGAADSLLRAVSGTKDRAAFQSDETVAQVANAETRKEAKEAARTGAGHSRLEIKH
jgi:hypothetical protein